MSLEIKGNQEDWCHPGESRETAGYLVPNSVLRGLLCGRRSAARIRVRNASILERCTFADELVEMTKIWHTYAKKSLVRNTAPLSRWATRLPLCPGCAQPEPNIILMIFILN